MTKKEKIEVKIYKKIGIEKFKKLTLYLEKKIHKKDKGQNINYHPKKLTKGSIKKFRKFFYYNGFIHSRNLIFGVPLLIVMIIFKLNPIFITFLSLWLLKDAYCVMLQRYNWIETNETLKRIVSIEQEKIEDRKKDCNIEKLKEILKEKNIDKEECIKKIEDLKNVISDENDKIIEFDNSLEVIEELLTCYKPKVKQKRLIKEEK
ncbi:MAG: hypothetical protein MR550_03845 [Bacilli bacterium]|nr:hypothetical protein [Bacilli bacterium]